MDLNFKIRTYLMLKIDASAKKQASASLDVAV